MCLCQNPKTLMSNLLSRIEVSVLNIQKLENIQKIILGLRTDVKTSCLIFVSESVASKGLLSANDDAVIKVLCTAVSECPLEHLKSHQLPAKLVADHDTNAPDDLQTVLNHLCPRLISKNRASQITAYRLLQKYVLLKELKNIYVSMLKSVSILP